MTKFGLGLGGGGVDLGGIGNVALDGEDFDAELLGKFGGEILESFETAGHNDEIGALASESGGHLDAETRTGAGDGSNFT